MRVIFKNEKGLSILEILASILLLSIIIISFLPLFFQSGKAIEKSGEVIESTYSGQSLMEEIYEISNTISFSKWIESTRSNKSKWEYIETNNSCEKHFQIKSEENTANLYISKTVDENPTCEMKGDMTMKNVLITISTSKKPNVIESQMETILIWEN